MIIKNFKPFIGVHCETTTTGCLLNHLGIELSEPMLFGLGEGLGYIYWNMKLLNSPFIGGRIKQVDITRNLAKNLNLSLDIKETTSIKKAWKNVIENIDNGFPVGLQLDSFYLEYFAIKFHFAGHFAAMYGYDDERAYLIDTRANGGIDKTRTSLKSLELARNERGPMSAKNLVYSIRGNSDGFELSDIIKTAISNNVKGYLNPPVKNFGYKGILKTSVEIKKWFKSSSNIEEEFTTVAMLMDEGGTGGAIFRNIYSEFLKESYVITKFEPLLEAHMAFKEIAMLWTEVSSLFKKAGKSKQVIYINQASEILVDLSRREYLAMKSLETLNY